jgi:hypothetical protein
MIALYSGQYCKNDEMNPLSGIQDHFFCKILILKRRLEAFFEFQKLVLFLTSAVTPSLDEGALLFLLILDG